MPSKDVAINVLPSGEKATRSKNSPSPCRERSSLCVARSHSLTASRASVPPVAKRMPVARSNYVTEHWNCRTGGWLIDKKNQCPGRRIALNKDMKAAKADWAKAQKKTVVDIE